MIHIEDEGLRFIRRLNCIALQEFLYFTQYFVLKLTNTWKMEWKYKKFNLFCKKTYATSF